jgi:hypothetical protein
VASIPLRIVQQALIAVPVEIDGRDTFDFLSTAAPRSPRPRNSRATETHFSQCNQEKLTEFRTASDGRGRFASWRIGQKGGIACYDAVASDNAARKESC